MLLFKEPLIVKSGPNNYRLKMLLRNWKANLSEIHIAVVGANGSGKTALTVKYMTRKFISEYDPNLEDTYCKHDVISGQEFMVWIMDTVEGAEKDPNRYIGWADVFLVVYNITNRASFEFAEQLLKKIAGHNHRLCIRQHLLYLIGNKSDMERYRQVSKAQAAALAAEHTAEFFETNCCEQFLPVQQIFHGAIESAANLQALSRTGSPFSSAHESPSPSPKPTSSDSEKSSVPASTPTNENPPAQKKTHRRARTKSPGAKDQVVVKHEKVPSAPSGLFLLTAKKSNAGQKLLKLFQLNNNDQRL